VKSRPTSGDTQHPLAGTLVRAKSGAEEGLELFAFR
jgi:hypothetical protein